jgi:hypothetical protein
MTDERDPELLAIFSSMPIPASGDPFVERALARVQRARRVQLLRRLLAMVALLAALALATPRLVEVTMILARFTGPVVATLVLQPYDPVSWITAILLGLLFLKRVTSARR